MARKKEHPIITLITTPIFIKELFRSDKIEVQDLGVFEIKSMRERKGFNPGTGKYEKFPGYNKMSFEPSSKFRKKLQKWKQKV